MEEDVYSKFYKTWLENARKFMTPWMPGQGGTETGSSSATSEKESSPINLPKDWAAQSQSFFEKMMWFPPFSVLQGTAGPTLTWYKEYWELAVLYTELYQEWTNLYLDFSRAMMSIVTSTNAKMLGANPMQPKEAYNALIGGMAQGIDELLRDQKIAAKLGRFLSKVLETKKKADALMENYYAMMNIPTKSEMDKVYRELYLLKKKIRVLEKKDSILRVASRSEM